MTQTIIERQINVDYIPHKFLFKSPFIDTNNVLYETYRQTRSGYDAALYVPVTVISFDNKTKVFESRLYVPGAILLKTISFADFEFEMLRFNPNKHSFKMDIYIGTFLVATVLDITKVNLELAITPELIAYVDKTAELIVTCQVESDIDVEAKATIKFQYDNIYTDMVEVVSAGSNEIAPSSHKYSF